ncbi:unnamed protein product [Discosporangium mesarthrocarpum]
MGGHGVILFPSSRPEEVAKDMGGIVSLTQKSEPRLRAFGSPDDHPEGQSANPMPDPMGPQPSVLPKDGLRDWDAKWTLWQGFCGMPGRVLPTGELTRVAGDQYGDREEDGSGEELCSMQRLPFTPAALLLRVHSAEQAYSRLAEAVGEWRASRKGEALRGTLNTGDCQGGELNGMPLLLFAAAAEGLHGALMYEARDAWHEAQVGASFDASDTEQDGEGQKHGDCNDCDGNRTKLAPEHTLPRLARCCLLIREAGKCAFLLASLLLDDAARIATGRGGAGEGAVAWEPRTETSSPNHSTTGLRRLMSACHWLLLSGTTPVVEAWDLLEEASARVESCLGGALAAEGGRDSLSGRGLDDSWTSDVGTLPSTETEVQELRSGAGGTDQANRGTGQPVWSVEGIAGLEGQQALSRALSVCYASYLCPVLGTVAQWGGSSREMDASQRAPPLFSSGGMGLEGLSRLDVILCDLIGHLQDGTGLAPGPGQRAGDRIGGGPGCPTLAQFVVCARRVPWARCHSALSSAYTALIAQCLRSHMKLLQGVGRDGGDALYIADNIGEDGGDRRTVEGSEATEETDEGGVRDPWLAAAILVLQGYQELAGGRLKSSSRASTGGDSAGSGVQGHDGAIGVGDAEDWVLQLACEGHPLLVIGGTSGGEYGGPLSRRLVEGGRARPLVLALVELSVNKNRKGYGVGMVTGHGSVYRALDFLQLSEASLSPTVDPLEALRVLGWPGRQVDLSISAG